MVLINNIGQIVPAIGAQGDIKDSLVSILSVCNCLGRLACGAVGDYALRWDIPRPSVFGWFIALMVIAMGCLALASPAALYAASAIGGFSYGAINGITPPIYSEVFGASAALLSAVAGYREVVKRIGRQGGGDGGAGSGAKAARKGDQSATAGDGSH